jgi:two-component system chemotaxis response regulator CheV
MYKAPDKHAHAPSAGHPSSGSAQTRLELLLFKLDGPEVFAINVLKVREVTYAFEITQAPGMGTGIAGMTSLRGQIIPVIDPSVLVHMGMTAAPTKPGALMVTEFNGGTYGFLVHSVDHIVVVDWSEVRSPLSAISGAGSMVSAIVELESSQLVTVLDVEAILAQAVGDTDIPALDPVAAVGRRRNVLVVDDSAFARRKIGQVLEGMQVDCQAAASGLVALEQLSRMAAAAESEGVALASRLDLILTDVEMPEMDGYTLTRRLKADARFRDIPVVMHSSLTSVANSAQCTAAGGDAYVAKFDPVTLAATMRPYFETALTH